MNDDKQSKSVPALLHQDLSIVHHGGFGQRKRYIIKDPRASLAIELGEEEFYLIQLLSDELEPAAVCRAFLAKYSKRITPEELTDFVDYLGEIDILAKSSGEQDSALAEQPDSESIQQQTDSELQASDLRDVAESVEESVAVEDAAPEAEIDGPVPIGRQEERRKRRRERFKQKFGKPLEDDRQRPLERVPYDKAEPGAGPRAQSDDRQSATSPAGNDLGETRAAATRPSSEAAARAGEDAPAVTPSHRVKPTTPGMHGGDDVAHTEHDASLTPGFTHPGEERSPSHRTETPGHRRHQKPSQAREQREGMVDRGRPDQATDAQDVEGTRSGYKGKYWLLFNPSNFLGSASDLLAGLRYVLYLLPVLLPMALLTLMNNSYALTQDIDRLLQPVTLIQHLVFSLLTVNLFSKLIQGMACRFYGADVKGFGIVLAFGIVPRFFVTIKQAWDLPQNARLWVFAAPLLTKLFIFSAGVVLWLLTRHMDNLLSFFLLAVSMTAIMSFSITANPLLSSDGYRVLATYLGVQNLKPIARGRLFSWIKGEAPENPELSNGVLIGYAIASMLFGLMVFVILGFFITAWLQINLHGVGIILALFFLIYLGKRGLGYAKGIQEGLSEGGGVGASSDWRKRIKVKRRDVNAGKRRYRLAMLLLLLPILFLPYPYETGGKFIILPAERQEIHVEVPGMIEQVFHDGGEFLKQGTVIAKLSSYQSRKEVAVYQAQVREKQALIAELRTSPRPEQVRLAEAEVDLAKVQSKFSIGELARYQDLYKKQAVSLDDLEDARRRMEIDQQKIVESKAKLDLVLAGSHPDEVAAAEAELQRYLEQVRFYEEELRRSTILMPFDGRIVELNLKQRRGQYLSKGDLLAEVENTSYLFAAIEVPETDIGEVAIDADSRLKPWAMPNRPFNGKVTNIEPKVIEQPFGNVVKVLVRLENKDGVLHSGMSGYAKIQGNDRPVWEAFTRMIVRFVMVELWSWVP